MGHVSHFPLQLQASRTICGSEGREAVHRRDADLDLDRLAVGGYCGNAIAKGLETVHLCPDPASCEVTGTTFPDGPAIVRGGSQGFVPCQSCRTVLFPRAPVLADRADRCGLAVEDGGVAAPGLAGAIGGHRADLVALADLPEQIRQIRAVTIAARRDSTTRMSDVAVSIASCTLPHWRRP